MRDALAVGEDQRRSLVGLGLAEGVQRLLRVGAHGDLRDVDIAIGDRLESEILACHPLAGARELRHGAERRRLRGLAAGVGVDLGVEDQDVDVASARQHVVEAAVADVVGPAVAADDPDAAPDQMIDHRQEIARRFAVLLEEPGLQFGDADSLGADFRLLNLRCIENAVGKFLADDRSKIAQERPREVEMLVGGKPEPKAELGIVFEQRIRPSRPAPFPVLRPRGDRLAGPVDRRTAGGIGDLRAVAEQLRQEFQVRRLAAPGARAGELEQRLEELHAAHVGEIDAGAIVDRQLLEKGDVGPFGCEERLLARHVDRLDARLARARDRAGLDAEAAAGAVLHVELQREARFRVAARIDRRRLERGGRGGEQILVVVARTDDAVRTNEAALSALDAEILLPDRDLVGDVALLVGAGAGGKRAVGRNQADGNVVAAPDEHLRRHLPHEIGRIGGHDGRAVAVAADGCRDLDLEEALQRSVDGGEVLRDDRFALAAVTSCGSIP